MSTDKHPSGNAGDTTWAERVVVWQRSVLPRHVDEDLVRRWLAHAVTRIQVDGGDILAQLGTTLVFAFDAVDSEESLELSLALLQDAVQHFPPLRLSFGVAVGGVGHNGPSAGTAYDGAALDRAQALCNGARDGDIQVDETAFERLSEHYLFGREISAQGHQGHAIDMETPRKRSCRKSVPGLRRAPIPQARRAAFDSLRERADGSMERSVLLRSDSTFEPLDWLARIAEVAVPPFQLHLRSQAAGLQPLGSLQAALAHSASAPAIAKAIEALPHAHQQALATIRSGGAVHRSEAVQALAALLNVSSDAPWVVLHRLHDIDAASLGVLAECRNALPAPPLLFASVPHNAAVPSLLFPDGDRHELVLDDLSTSDRQATAAAILELPVDSPVARRVALLADSSPLGILEACRTLVAAGDLVAGEQGFRWRAGPRHTQAAIPVEALIAERMSGMSPLAYRMLEVLSVVPSVGSQALCVAVAERDGARVSDAGAGLEQLQQDGFVDASLDLGHAESLIRSAVRNAMPPARGAELNRFVALCLIEDGELVRPQEGFGRALLAHHQAEGGLHEEAALTLLDASSDALQCGFQRMAVRLAATAVELDPSPHARARASELTGHLETPGTAARAAAQPATAPSAPPSEDRNTRFARRSLRQAVSAIRAGDLELVEQLLDTATAAGGSRRAAKRLHAMALLAADDTERALQVLQQGHASVRPGADDARETLTLALIRLQSGDIAGSTRAALSCLSASRKRNDQQGEQAALLVLAACYSASGQSAKAAALQTASEHVGS